LLSETACSFDADFKAEHLLGKPEVLGNQNRKYLVQKLDLMVGVVAFIYDIALSKNGLYIWHNYN